MIERKKQARSLVMPPERVQEAVQLLRSGAQPTEIAAAIGCSYSWARKIFQDLGRSPPDPKKYEIIVPSGVYPLKKQIRDHYFITPLAREEGQDFDRYTAIGWRIVGPIDPVIRAGIAKDLLRGDTIGVVTRRWGCSTRQIWSVRDWVVAEFEKNGTFGALLERIEVRCDRRPAGYDRGGRKFFRFFRRGRKRDGKRGVWIGYLINPQIATSPTWAAEGAL